MCKRQDWFVTTCVYLLFSLASQIHSTSHTHFQGIDSSSKTNHFHGIHRLNVPTPHKTISNNNQNKLKKKDLIKKLPGQPSVSFRQYGGYVAVDESATRHLYYYFVEAINANSSTPLVLWFNGGPGCSSLLGAFTEHGPFRVHSNGKKLYRNPYSWNHKANILYLEAPAKVGFSYMTTPENEYLPNFLKQGDKLTAEDNYAFLVKWLERFPEYKGREFYISGQSYAGHYAPQLAQLIIQRNNQTFINLKGVIIGNPSLGKAEDEKGEEAYLVDHAIFDEDTQRRFKGICSREKEANKEDLSCGYESVAFSSLTNYIDTYNIYAPRCLNSTLTNKPKKHTTVLHYDPCSKKYMEAYLNREKVQGAMHANTTRLPYPWSECAGMFDDWSEADASASILPILSELLGAGVRLMIYSGDTDSVVPFTSTRLSLKKLNQTVEEVWRPWLCEGEVGGYVKVYKNNFTFVTVRGAGHSVPSYQPIRALALFSNFIRNTRLPDFSQDLSYFQNLL